MAILVVFLEDHTSMVIVMMLKREGCVHLPNNLNWIYVRCVVLRMAIIRADPTYIFPPLNPYYDRLIIFDVRRANGANEAEHKAHLIDRLKQILEL